MVAHLKGRAIPAESCVVGEVGGSSWPVAEDAPNILEVPPEIAIELQLNWHQKTVGTI